MDPGTMMLLASLVSAGASAYSASQSGSKGEQGSTYTKGQQGYIDDVLNSLKKMRGGGTEDITQNENYQTGQNWLQSMFNDPEFFKNIEAPAMRQFNEEIVPGLANRFASMGSGGALGSTGFRNQLAREGSNLATNLAAQRGQWQQNAIPQLLNYAQQPFNNYAQLSGIALQPTQNTYTPPNAGGAANIWAGLSSAAMQGYGNNPSGGGYNGGGYNDNLNRQYGAPLPYVPGQAASTY